MPGRADLRPKGRLSFHTLVDKQRPKARVSPPPNRCNAEAGQAVRPMGLLSRLSGWQKTSDKKSSFGLARFPRREALRERLLRRHRTQQWYARMVAYKTEFVKHFL